MASLTARPPALVSSPQFNRCLDWGALRPEEQVEVATGLPPFASQLFLHPTPPKCKAHDLSVRGIEKFSQKSPPSGKSKQEMGGRCNIVFLGEVLAWTRAN